MPPANPTPRKSVAPESLEGDLISPQDPLYGIIWMNPERLSGAPCFFGTRVPVKNLFDYIEANESLDSFLDDFPGVEREQAIAVLEAARNRLLPKGAAA
jgi:uncharacterized protein (DUF433 family)